MAWGSHSCSKAGLILPQLLPPFQPTPGVTPGGCSRPSPGTAGMAASHPTKSQSKGAPSLWGKDKSWISFSCTILAQTVLEFPSFFHLQPRTGWNSGGGGGNNSVFLMNRAGKGSAGILSLDLQPHPESPHGLGGPTGTPNPQSGKQMSGRCPGRGGGRSRARPHRPIPGGAAGAALCPYKARLGSPGPIRAGMGTPEPGPAQGSSTCPGERGSPCSARGGRAAAAAPPQWICVRWEFCPGNSGPRAATAAPL